MAKGKTTGIVIGWIGTALATAVIAGGGMYFWRGAEIHDLQQNLDILSVMRNQQQLQNTAANAANSTNSTTNTTPPTAEPTDARRLLTYDPNQGYGIDNLTSCLPKESDANAFNFADPTTTVHFSKADFGFAIDLPWNPAWGTSQCRVNPYEVFTSGDGFPTVSFGPLEEGEGGLGRTYSISVRPGRSASTAFAAIGKEIKDIQTQAPTRERLSDIEVMTYGENGLCDMYFAEVINPLVKNYVLSGGCGAPPYSDERARFETWLKTLKFL